MTRLSEKCGVWRMDGDRMVNMITGEELVDPNPETCYTSNEGEDQDDLMDLWDKLVTVLKGDNTP